MISVAHKLAITGILQHKVPAAPTPTIVETSLGAGTYTGFSPTIATPALPIIVVSPSLGQGTYTGFAPTASVVALPTLTFTTQQISSTGNTPWIAYYYVYNSALVVIDTIVHEVNRGNSPPFPSFLTTTKSYATLPYYLEIQVRRLNDGDGGAAGVRTNAPGSVLWQRNFVTVQTINFLANQTFNQFYPTTAIADGTTFGVLIFEG